LFDHIYKLVDLKLHLHHLLLHHLKDMHHLFHHLLQQNILNQELALVFLLCKMG
jgi:hypothetical protein